MHGICFIHGFYAKFKIKSVWSASACFAARRLTSPDRGLDLPRNPDRLYGDFLHWEFVQALAERALETVQNIPECASTKVSNQTFVSASEELLLGPYAHSLLSLSCVLPW